MSHYIDKDALVAEINKLIKKNELYLDDNVSDSVRFQKTSAYSILNEVLHFINTLEVKEVDLGKEIRRYRMNNPIIGHREESLYDYMTNVAKHFFELGLNASNPIAEENLESFVRQVIDLDVEAGEYYNNIIEEERKGNRGSFLMINLLNGNIDAKELGIQYVLNKLKAKKGE